MTIEAGNVYGRLTAIRKMSGGGKRARWMFKCECEKEIDFAASSVLKGNNQRCGRQCPIKLVRPGSRCSGVAGEKHNGLTLISFSHVHNNAGYYTFLCECGNLTIARLAEVRNGSIKSCGCLRRRRMASQNKPRYPLEIVALNRIKKHIIRWASVRRIAFNLEDSEILHLIAAPCNYCGDAGSNVCKIPNRPNFVYNGIDRVDSQAGYTSENSVSCCVHCNRSKSDRSKEEFFAWAARVASYADRLHFQK